MIRRILVATAASSVFLAPALPAGAGGFCGPGNFEDRATTDVEMKGDCFDPVVVRVDAGDQVTFENLDSYAHTVGGVAWSFGDAHEEIAAGESISYRFEDEGVYPFFCVIHPGMAGAVVVGNGSATGAESGAAVPVEPAAASGPNDAAPASDGLPAAMILVIGAAALILAGIGTFVLRRRRPVAAA